MEYTAGKELLDQPGDILLAWAVDADELRRSYETDEVRSWKKLIPDKERVIAVLKGVIPVNDFRAGRLEENKGETWEQFKERVEAWRTMKPTRESVPPAMNSLSAKRPRSPQIQSLDVDQKNGSIDGTTQRNASTRSGRS